MNSLNLFGCVDIVVVVAFCWCKIIKRSFLLSFSPTIKVWFTTEYPSHIKNRNGQYPTCDNSLISKDFYDQINAHRCALFYIQYFVMCFKTTLTRMANCDNAPLFIVERIFKKPFKVKSSYTIYVKYKSILEKIVDTRSNNTQDYNTF